MNKNTDPRSRAGEKALQDLRELRALWADYKEARRKMQNAMNAGAELHAVKAALAAEHRIAELLAPEPAVLSAFETDIPGRPGWTIETEEPDERQG